MKKNDAWTCRYYRVGEVARSLVRPAEQILDAGVGGDLDADPLAVASTPELLPCGYLVGDYNQIHVFIKVIAHPWLF